MQSKISTLVGLKNNLEYSQHFYKTFRQIYPTEELVFVSYGSTDETDIWINELSDFDDNVIAFHEDEEKTFSDTYNKAIELATKDFVVFAHNDMVVAPGFLENLEKHIHPINVVSYSQIEPPIFNDHQRPGKFIRDFGTDLINFKNDELQFFIQDKIQGLKGQTEPGITFFMCLSRQVLLDIGGFDNIFDPYFSEDDDLIKRLKLKGLTCFTSLDSIVYHFVSKTSRFSEEAKTKTQQIERNSNRTFLRKWGSMNSNNRFNVGFIVENCTEQLLEVLEPWCNNLYVNIDPTHYIYKEQPTTKFNLNERILHGYEEDNDIIIRFDGSKLDNNNFEIIKNLQNILGNTFVGEQYEIDIFEIKVNNLTNNIQDLIFIPKQTT